MNRTLERIRELVPVIRRRSAEIELARRLPLDLVADLRSAGCFRMFVPADFGGDELTLGQASEVIEELARADGSTGWTAMTGSGTPLFLALLPKTTFESLYADGPDVVGAGALAPMGRAVPVHGGYCVTGVWPFASGCQHADLLLAQAMILADDKPLLAHNGAPETCVAVFQADEVEIIDTWHVAGLQGTGSHHFKLSESFCPLERTFSISTSTPAVDFAAYAIPLLTLLPFGTAAVALGIARGALDDFVELAATGSQDRLGEADAVLRAARAMFYDDAARVWDFASRGEPLHLVECHRLRATASQAVAMATRVIDAAYSAGGASSTYHTSPLQRRFRDIHTLTQHVMPRGTW